MVTYSDVFGSGSGSGVASASAPALSAPQSAPYADMEARRKKKRARKSIGPAARACKGKRGGAFRSCVRQKMRGR